MATAGNELRPRRDRSLGGLSALSFMAGGLMTYVDDRWTPPLYLAGSLGMLPRALSATAGDRRPSRPRRGSVRHGRGLLLVVAVAVMIIAFSLGFGAQTRQCAGSPPAALAATPTTSTPVP